ncbi:hypothetical protein IFO70_10360 [Phormidium tenue FACHB-886]|nr:hypothetical protein [Phormidium tenue FACHB-886]
MSHKTHQVWTIQNGQALIDSSLRRARFPVRTWRYRPRSSEHPTETILVFIRLYLISDMDRFRIVSGDRLMVDDIQLIGNVMHWAITHPPDDLIMHEYAICVPIEWMDTGEPIRFLAKEPQRSNNLVLTPRVDPEEIDRLRHSLDRIEAEHRLLPSSSTAPNDRDCANCKHYNGEVYDGNKLICAMHPYGVKEEVCPDKEEYPLDEYVKHWILDGKTPIPYDDHSHLEWAQWYEAADCIVAWDEVEKVKISTVFLGLNFRFGEGRPPLLFETIINGGEYDPYCVKYTTWEDAEAGHAIALALVNNSSHRHR